MMIAWVMLGGKRRPPASRGVAAEPGRDVSLAIEPRAGAEPGEGARRVCPHSSRKDVRFVHARLKTGAEPGSFLQSFLTIKEFVGTCERQHSPMSELPTIMVRQPACRSLIDPEKYEGLSRRGSRGTAQIAGLLGVDEGVFRCRIHNPALTLPARPEPRQDPVFDRCRAPGASHPRFRGVRAVRRRGRGSGRCRRPPRARPPRANRWRSDR